MIKYFYMLCTDDKYELPVATFDSGKELARYLGRKPMSVYCGITRGYRVRYHGKLYKIIKIEIKRKDEQNENDSDL